MRVGVVTWRAAATDAAAFEGLPSDAAGYSAGLYAALHRLDGAGLDRIVVETPPYGDAWEAVHDRLRRAAHG
jgi:L-threonylcarbamoyladenylate synthase